MKKLFLVKLSSNRKFYIVRENGKGQCSEIFDIIQKEFIKRGEIIISIELLAGEDADSCIVSPYNKLIIV